MKVKLREIYSELKALKKVTNQADFSYKLGYNSTYISEILNEKEPISEKIIAKLEEKFRINPKYIKSGIDEMFLATDSAVSKVNEVKPVAHEQYMEVPYLPAIAQAGYVSDFADTLITGAGTSIVEMDTKLIPREYEKGNYLVVEIVGDSMDDGTDRSLAEGDKLLVKELERSAWNYKLNHKRYLFVIATKEGVVCKQVTHHNVERKIITCHSFNQIYHDYYLNLDTDVLQMFYVKKIVEKQIRL